MLILASLVFAQEQLTITTYYPSPYGVYGEISFGSEPVADLPKDKISLYGNRIGQTTMYGFGVEPSALYYKTYSIHRWYAGTNADGGVSDVMELDQNGNLTIKGNLSANNLPACKRYTFTATSGTQTCPAGYTITQAPVAPSSTSGNFLCCRYE